MYVRAVSTDFSCIACVSKPPRPRKSSCLFSVCLFVVRSFTRGTCRARVGFHPPNMSNYCTYKNQSQNLFLSRVDRPPWPVLAKPILGHLVISASTPFKKVSCFYQPLPPRCHHSLYYYSLPDAPMCGCIEGMPEVSQADCTTNHADKEGYMDKCTDNDLRTRFGRKYSRTGNSTTSWTDAITRNSCT